MEAESEESKDIPINVSLSDFICPITNQLFFNPVQVMPCGHFFEESGIDDWKTRDTTCPCCREKIEEQYPTPPYFNRQLTELLERNPLLYDECYFNLEIFSNCLREDDEKKTVSPHLKKWTNLLKNSKTHSNNAFPFLISKEYGLTYLTKHALILEKITAETLNAMQEGSNLSPLYILSKSELGRTILLNNGWMRNLIQKETLNKVIITHDEDNGKSAAHWLSTDGRKILLSDPVLSLKIEREEKKAVPKSFFKNMKDKFKKLEICFKLRKPHA